MCLHECIHEILCHRRWHRIAFLQVTNDKKQNCVSSQAFANQRLRYYEIFQKGGSEAALVFLFDDRAEQARKNTEAAATKVVVVTASVSNPTSPSTVDPRVAAAVAIAGAASASKVPRKRTVQSRSGGVLQEECQKWNTQFNHEIFWALLQHSDNATHFKSNPFPCLSISLFFLSSPRTRRLSEDLSILFFPSFFLFFSLSQHTHIPFSAPYTWRKVMVRTSTGYH